MTRSLIRWHEAAGPIIGNKTSKLQANLPDWRGSRLARARELIHGHLDVRIMTLRCLLGRFWCISLPFSRFTRQSKGTAH